MEEERKGRFSAGLLTFAQKCKLPPTPNLGAAD